MRRTISLALVIAAALAAQPARAALLQESGRPVSFGPSVTFEDDTGLGLEFDLATGVATITHVVPEPPLAALLLACAVPLARLRRRRA